MVKNIFLQNGGQSNTFVHMSHVQTTQDIIQLTLSEDLYACYFELNNMTMFCLVETKI